ncbi:MAG: chorismate synthase [Oscillospiraceae bacterium]
MKNTFGQSVTLTLFGESHGPAVGAVLDGLAPGLPVDEEFLRRQLARRRPATAMDTPRREPDNYQILSGVWQGRTTGTPLTIVIPNENTRSGDYTYGLARPSHADYAAYCKYHGFEDWRGGGHFSGRVTAPLVAAGAILLTVLRAVGVTVGTHILRCGEAWDRPFADAAADIAALGRMPLSPRSIRRRARRSAARFSPRGTRTTASAASRRPPSAACPPGWASRGSTASRAC